MNTARLKNIVIIILLLANAFLLVLLASRRAEEHSAYERSLEQLTALYSTNGIALDEELVKQAAAQLLSAEPSRDLAAEQELAEGIIGSASSIDSGGGIYRYYNASDPGSGVCLIRSGGTVEANVNRAVDDPDKFCTNLCTPYGYLIYETLDDGRNTTVTAYRTLNGLEVFNCALTFSFTGGTLETVSGLFLPPIKADPDNAVPLDVVTALVRFLDYRTAAGAVCTEIVSLSGGYLLQSTTSSPLQLIPVLRVETDVSSYYVNAATGEVTRE